MGKGIDLADCSQYIWCNPAAFILSRKQPDPSIDFLSKYLLLVLYLNGISLLVKLLPIAIPYIEQIPV